MEKINPTILELLRKETGTALVSFYLPPLGSTPAVKRGLRSMTEVIKLLQFEIDAQTRPPAVVLPPATPPPQCHLCIAAVEPGSEMLQCTGTIAPEVPCGKLFHPGCAQRFGGAMYNAGPANPVEGMVVMVGPSPQFEFKGHAGQHATYRAGRWEFSAPSCPTCGAPFSAMKVIVAPEVKPAPVAPAPVKVEITPEKAQAISNLQALIAVLKDSPRSSLGYCCFASKGAAFVFSPPVMVDKITFKMQATYYLDPVTVGIPSDGLDHSKHECVSPGNTSVCHFQMLLDDILDSKEELDPAEVEIKNRLLAAVDAMAAKVQAYRERQKK